MPVHIATHIYEIAIGFCWLLLSLSLHEWGHAFVAVKFGDPTPRVEGRLSLNPMAHISFWGTIVIPLLMAFTSSIRILGWAKPVMVNPSNFKHRSVGDLCCSIAGPLMNLLFAFVLMLVGLTLRHFGISFAQVFYVGAEINVSLFLFNFIPLPPLDGGQVLKTVTRMSEEMFLQLSQVGTFALLILINTPVFENCFWEIHHKVLGMIWQLCCVFF